VLELPPVPPVNCVTVTFDSDSLIWKAFPKTPGTCAVTVTTPKAAEAVTNPLSPVAALIAAAILVAWVATVPEMSNSPSAATAPEVFAVKVTLQRLIVSALVAVPVDVIVAVAATASLEDTFTTIFPGRRPFEIPFNSFIILFRLSHDLSFKFVC
jgi:hypothetical protein